MSGRSIRFGALWAAGASAVGTVLWALLTATVAPVVDGEPWRQIADLWTVRIWGYIYFGGFVALLAAVPHTVLFGGWLTACEIWPRIEGSTFRRVLACLVLALPFTAFMFNSYAGQPFGMAPSWGTALRALPWVAISAAGGILCTRLMIRQLREFPNGTAAEPGVEPDGPSARGLTP